ncbi:MAG: BTAD domain-containing putative transcriptional regulator [Thermoleophilia bacterium]
MAITLTLLDGVRWRGAAVAGQRPQALLAALAQGDGRPVRAERLVESVWGDREPAEATKALQVLVSRTRSICAPEAVVREGEGYRLGVPRDEVDSALLLARAAGARRALARDAVAARDLAREALSLAAPLDGAGDDGGGDGVLAELRREARAAAGDARTVLARALSRTGEHADALPVLERAAAAAPGDEALLADLLRSEAAVRGPAAALERYEAHRVGLRERLGATPGEELRRVHRELLAKDSPVREGLRYDPTPLLGRDDDLRRLRAAVAEARVVSIVGAGGLGKTRLAHVLGRESDRAAVHFVELVGVTSGEDVVGEVGAALGVRDSVSSRRALTPEQRNDVRGRVAQQLDAAPSLLILDNCEHVVGAVAELAAHLVAVTRDLRIVTTTRAPLGIRAERVYPLGELDPGDAAELFRTRALAVRPGAALDAAAVAEVVERLDGVPLALELAAAKVRAMSVEDIARRLGDRFALLRDGDRSAPDRHRTLLAVIDWSWNLLGDDERRALRRLSVFADGFGPGGAEGALGPGALDVVGELADQSLLTVVDDGATVRYRMLETVREFGRMKLDEAGEAEAARDAYAAWARDFAAVPRLLGRDQVAAVDEVRAEEANLADVLRRSIEGGERETAIAVLGALAPFWTIVGDHARTLALLDAVEELVDGWTPPPELADAARSALSMMIVNSFAAAGLRATGCRRVLERIGPESDDPALRAGVRVLLGLGEDPGADSDHARLDDLTRSDDRRVAAAALQWKSHALENAGDPEAALECARAALGLVDEREDGPWSTALLRTVVATLYAQRGRLDEAGAQAAMAVPVLERLGAWDDAMQLRSVLAMAAIARGEPGADRRVEEILDASRIHPTLGGQIWVSVCRGELELARGHVEQGLAHHRVAVAEMRNLRYPLVTDPGGLAPWVLYSEAVALAAAAVHGADDDGLFELLAGKARRVMAPGGPVIDYPVTGLVLYGLGSWGLLRDALAPATAVRLLVLADRFAYNRLFPSVAWEHVAGPAERRAPGALAAVAGEFGDRRGPALLDEARAAVEGLLVP